MDLVALWEHVPPLLAACMGEHVHVLRYLRLVSKESSRVALLGLRSYTLSLTGVECYRNVSGARLLRHTRLDTLNVHLLLSGSYNPSLMLESFVWGAGRSLNTITKLILCSDNTSGSSICSNILSEAIAVLIAACPALRTLSSDVDLSPALLCCLSKSCPLLSSLIIIGAGSSDLPYLNDTLLDLQPALLPKLSSLAFKRCGYDFYRQLPDMSHNSSITTCSLSDCILNSIEDWLCLPPTLRHLRCGTIEEGPPGLSGGAPLIPNLLSVETFGEWRLRPLAQLLQAVPSLVDFKLSPSSYERVHQISINLGEPTASSASFDLALLQELMDVHTSLKAANHHLLRFRNPGPGLVGALHCCYAMHAWHQEGQGTQC